MLTVICKYYLKFPSLLRNGITFSLNGFMGGMGIDYFVPNPENILLGCDEVLNKKIFSA